MEDTEFDISCIWHQLIECLSFEVRFLLQLIYQKLEFYILPKFLPLFYLFIFFVPKITFQGLIQADQIWPTTMGH